MGIDARVRTARVGLPFERGEGQTQNGKAKNSRGENESEKAQQIKTICG